MWSLGCVLAEVALQRPLFPAHTPSELLRQVRIFERAIVGARLYSDGKYLAAHVLASSGMLYQVCMS